MRCSFGPYDVLIDRDDWDALASYAWKITENHGRLEAIAWIDGRAERMHRLVWTRHNGPIPQGIEVDHVNRNSLDNRRSNLRLATAAQNLANRSKYGGSSRYKGVRRRGNRWTAQIQIEGRQINLGSFRSEAAAARAYDDAARRHYGQFAGTNH